MRLIERDWLKPGLYSHGAAEAEASACSRRAATQKAMCSSMGTAGRPARQCVAIAAGSGAAGESSKDSAMWASFSSSLRKLVQ